MRYLGSKESLTEPIIQLLADKNLLRRELVFFDDGESQKRQNALIGDKEKILNFIRKSDYTIMWSLLGEKQITNVFDFKAERYLQSYSQIAYLKEDGTIVQSHRKTFSR